MNIHSYILTTLAVVAVALHPTVAADTSSTSMCPPGIPRKVLPLFDHPLRDTAICRGPDNIYYLTGTVETEINNPNSKIQNAVDFQNNDGIWLWKSADLKKWEPMGQVWSISRDPVRFGSPHFGNISCWQMTWRASKDPTVPSPVRGMIAPEIHYIKSNFYITYSMNGYGSGLLKSETGKPEGPYRDLGRMVLFGGDPSLFEDEDGAVYFVWGEGWIARMKDDLSELAEAPRPLEVKPEIQSGWRPTWWGTGDSRPLWVGAGGAFVFKADSPGMKQGKYHLVGYEEVSRMGPVRCFDTYIATSETVYGPYQRRDIMVPHGGQSTVFQGPDQQYYATFSGSDEWAAVRNKPAIVPLVPHATVVGADYWWCGAFVKPFYPVSEGGAWSEIDPFIKDINLRDITVLNAPDGYYYLTGTDMNYSNKALRPTRDKIGVQVWRSKDMKKWEDMGLVWKCDDTKETRAGLDKFLPLNQYFPITYDMEMHYLKKTFWLIGSMQTSKHWADKEGCLILILRSKSGKAEGPYEYVWKGANDCNFWTPSILEDDDGAVYIVGGGAGANVAKLNDDLSDFASARWTIHPDGYYPVGEGGHILKIGKRYIHTSAVWHGEDNMGPRFRLFSTYELSYFTADNLKGPWSKTRCAAPKCGNSRPFKDKQGQWWAPFFGNHFLGPWYSKPGAYPIKVREENGDVFLEAVQ